MRSPASDPRAWLRPAILALGALATPASAQVLIPHVAPVPAYSDTAVQVILDTTLPSCDRLDWLLDPAESSLETAGEDGTIRLLLFQAGCALEPLGWREVTLAVDLGVLPAGNYVVEFRDWEQSAGSAPRISVDLRVFDRPPCPPSDATLCLRGGRFGATATWRDFAGGTGSGHAVQRDPAAPFLADTGFLWFFEPDNFEVLVKVLDGCALNGHYWVFVSPGSTVEYTLTVTDHVTGAERAYRNALGNVPALVPDTSAFPCP